MKTAKLSIITIVKNDFKGLNLTIDSVVKSGICCEHLIVDGSDQILPISTGSKFIRHVWGQDLGISDAFNKGVSLAKNEYILFLNSGDELIDGSKKTIECVLANGVLDCAWFAVYRVFRDEERVIYKPRLRLLKYAMSAPHQGMILRRNVFKEIGGFPPQKYSMDHYFSLKMMKNKLKYKIKAFDEPIALYPSGGHSSKGKGLPFLYNVINTLRISPIHFPVSATVNLYLLIKSQLYQWRRGD